MNTVSIHPYNKETQMQNSMHVAVGRATTHYWEEQIIPLLQGSTIEHPVPAYVIAEKLGTKDITKVSIGLVGLHRYGHVDRVPFSDPASKTTRWAYFLPPSGAKAKFKPGTPRTPIAPSSPTTVKRKPSGILTVVPATYNIRIGERTHSLTENEARQLYQALAKQFAQAEE